MLNHTATVAQRLAAEGAVLVAKLTLGALAMGDLWFGGMTRNPGILNRAPVVLLPGQLPPLRLVCSRLPSAVKLWEVLCHRLVAAASVLCVHVWPNQSCRLHGVVLDNGQTWSHRSNHG